jgi:hypothetical protein
LEKGEGTTSEKSDVDGEMDLDDTVKIRNDTTGNDKDNNGTSSSSDFPDIADLVRSPTNTKTMTKANGRLCGEALGSSQADMEEDSDYAPLVARYSSQKTAFKARTRIRVDTDEDSDVAPLVTLSRSRRTASQVITIISTDEDSDDAPIFSPDRSRRNASRTVIRISSDEDSDDAPLVTPSRSQKTSSPRSKGIRVDT